MAERSMGEGGRERYVDLRPPVLGPGQTFNSITKKIGDIVLMRGFKKGWVFGFLIVFLGSVMLFNTIAYLVSSRSSTPGAHGWPTTSSRIRARWACGRNSAAR